MRPAPNIIRTINHWRPKITDHDGGDFFGNGDKLSKGTIHTPRKPVSKSWDSHPNPYHCWPDFKNSILIKCLYITKEIKNLKYKGLDYEVVQFLH